MCADRKTPEGVEIRGSSLRVTFFYAGKRCRETLRIAPTAANIKYAARLRAEVLNQIERQTFDYAATFPHSQIAKAAAPQQQIPTVGDLLDNLITSLEVTGSVANSTLMAYRSWIRTRLKPKWGTREVPDLTTADLRQWVLKELAPELSARSIGACTELLTTALDQAVVDGLIDTNPCRRLKPAERRPKKRAEVNRRKSQAQDPFNDIEIASILKHAGTLEERSLFAFAFASGLRSGELIGLLWEHVNLEQGWVLVRDNVVYGDKGSERKGTKTGVVRRLPLLPAAREALQALPRREGPVFLNPRTGRRWAHSGVILTHWTKTLQAAGVRYRNPYQTRHTFASKLLEQGEPTTLVAHLLGHASTEQVIKTYGKYIKQADLPTLRGSYENFATAPNLPQTTDDPSESQA